MLKKIPILTYHQIAPTPPPDAPLRQWTVAPEQFRDQLLRLRKQGYTGLSMRELLPYLQGKKQGKVVGITFDDGFQNVITHALPILNDVGFCATNFLLAGHVGGSNHWDHHHGAAPEPLMCADGIKQWLEAGNEIGSHTIDHVDLHQTSDDEARRQILHSKAMLEAVSGQPVTAFAYPYGRYTKRDAVFVEEAGYLVGLTTQTGRASVRSDRMQLPRLTVLGHETLPRFSWQVFSPLEDCRGAWRRFKQQVKSR